jgi:hypothetical protein
LGLPAQAPHAFLWRITLETPAMLRGGFASFLTANANQRFLPGLGHLSQLGADPRITAMQMLREDMAPCATPEGTADYAHVPFHWPSRCLLAVEGECVLTRACVADFASHFDSARNSGALFRWPPGAAVSLDFRTGEPLAPCAATTLLLVAHLICGTYDDRGAAGGKMNLVQRVQPRLMSIDSYYALVGEHRHAMTPPFYPDVVRAVTWRPGQRGAPLSAAALWARFCSVEKLMPSFEQLQLDELTPMLSALGMPNASLRPVEASRAMTTRADCCPPPRRHQHAASEQQLAHGRGAVRVEPAEDHRLNLARKQLADRHAAVRHHDQPDGAHCACRQQQPGAVLPVVSRRRHQDGHEHVHRLQLPPSGQLRGARPRRRRCRRRPASRPARTRTRFCRRSTALASTHRRASPTSPFRSAQPTSMAACLPVVIPPPSPPPPSPPPPSPPPPSPPPLPPPVRALCTARMCCALHLTPALARAAASSAARAAATQSATAATGACATMRACCRSAWLSFCCAPHRV